MTPAISKSDQLFSTTEPQRKRSYYEYPDQALPLTCYHFEQAQIAPDDILAVWNPYEKSLLFVGTYRPGGDGKTTFDIIEHFDAVNRIGEPYRPGAVWLEPTGEVRDIESDQWYVVQRVGKRIKKEVNGTLEEKLVAQQPEILSVLHDC